MNSEMAYLYEGSDNDAIAKQQSLDGALGGIAVPN